MDRKTTSLMTAAAALAALPAASLAQPAASPAVPAASSYAELLDPVPNAAERLQAVYREEATPQAQVIKAQYYHHHHHHHHNNYWYRQRGYVWNGWAWVPRRVYYGRRHYYHHHHHHHHHHNNY